MGYRQRLQALLQRQPQLRSQVALAPVALPCRPLRAAHFKPNQRRAETAASGHGADALRPYSSELSQLRRALGLIRPRFSPEPEQSVPVITLGGPCRIAGASNGGGYDIQ